MREDWTQPAGWTERLASLPALAILVLILQPFALGAITGAVFPLAHRDREPADRSAVGTGAVSPDTLARRLIEGEHVLSAYSGVSYTAPSDVHVERPDDTSFTIRNVRWDGQAFKNPIYYGVRIATWFKNLPLGLMLDFTHAKAISRPGDEVTLRGRNAGKPVAGRSTLAKVFRKLEFSHGHNILLLNGLARLPSGSARLRPYLGLGAGLAVPHLEIQETGAADRTYTYQVVGPAFQALVGIELRLANTSVFIEYKLSYSPYRPKLTDARGGTMRTDLLTSHFLGGFSLRAGRAPMPAGR